MEYSTALVIDNGTSTIKAGFAGDDAPRALFPTIVGKPKKSKAKNIKDCTDVYFGYDLDTISDSIITSNPIEEGYVKNWDDMEKIWEYTLVNQLWVAPEEHPILLTEAPLNPIKLREAATQVMFEVFNIPSFYLTNQWIAALYASGRTSGLVLESGEEITNMTSIYEGYTLPHSSQRLLLAGNDITKYLINILKERSIELSGTKEFTIAKDIKEKCCYIAEDFNTSLNESTPNYLYEEPYELPDGTSIKIRNERFRSPEILFQPELVGKI